MTEPNDLSNSSTEADETTSPPTNAQTDWFLQSLVNFANNWGVETGVTLQVGGMMVSGMIIAAPKYFDEFAANYASGLRNDPALGESFSNLITSYKKLVEVPPEEMESAPLPQYIHLKNALFFTPGQQPLSSQPVLWRGRITEVGGFFLGTLSAS
jgi:hypothetical protein